MNTIPLAEAVHDFPVWIRVTHFLNFLFIVLLIRSGIEILSSHPRLYFNDNCTPGGAEPRSDAVRSAGHEVSPVVRQARPSEERLPGRLAT